MNFFRNLFRTRRQPAPTTVREVDAALAQEVAQVPLAERPLIAKPVDVSETQVRVTQVSELPPAKPDAPSEPERDFTPRRVSAVGIKLLHDFEGCARRRSDGLIEAYPDPGTGNEPWTIGWGSTGQDHFNGGRIKQGTIWTKRQCDERFERDLVRYADDVIRALGSAIHATSQNQFDALVSFHYNTGAIARATLTRKHRAADFEGAAAEFARWNKAGGRVMAGLTRRRAAEAKIYRGDA